MKRKKEKIMSQLGRCTCGSLLVKAKVRNTKDLEMMEIELCPVCDTKNINVPEQKESPINKTMNLDRFGLEKLEK